MLYKWNLIGFENICGCVWVLWGNVVIVYEDVIFWYECDIFYFSVEWMILLDFMVLLDYMFYCFGKIIKNLDVFLDWMKYNMDEILGLIYFGWVLFKLVNFGMICEDVYDLI